jgi:anti-sigma-K factor RskA
MPRATPTAPGSNSSWWLALAASVLVAIAAGAYALHLRTEVQSLRNERADLEARFAVLNAFDAMRVTLQGQPDAPLADGRAVLSRARGLVFTARHLPALQPGRAYQLWIVTATAPVSMGLLNTAADGSTSAMVPIPANLGTPVAVAVTIEPEGGVPAPTGPKVLVGVVAPQ